MNFLAHTFLSGDNKDIILGGFIADMVKGKMILDYNNDVIKGIKLHRSIDVFTDEHHLVKQSKNRIKSKYNHYSGVVIDMYYDHFLAKNWNDYSNKDLKVFVREIYMILLRNYMSLPARGKRILPFMIVNNWLYNYSKLENLRTNFEGMARRTNFFSNMENAIEDLEFHYDDLYSDFQKFFPELMTFSSNLLYNKIR
jgi:acyl carrier protein phosphodiesterase